jgi:uncharacterized protein YjiS (DUF1127 family)
MIKPTQNFSGQLALSGDRNGPRVMAKLSAFAAAISRWCARRRQWRALMALDDRLLRDVGLTRAQAVEEACKPLRSRIFQ